MKRHNEKMVKEDDPVVVWSALRSLQSLCGETDKVRPRYKRTIDFDTFPSSMYMRASKDTNTSYTSHCCSNVLDGRAFAFCSGDMHDFHTYNNNNKYVAVPMIGKALPGGKG